MQALLERRYLALNTRIARRKECQYSDAARTVWPIG
jgi:hypothetical protein